MNLVSIRAQPAREIHRSPGSPALAIQDPIPPKVLMGTRLTDGVSIAMAFAWWGGILAEKSL